MSDTCTHSLIVILSWRPWRGYKVHEVCVRCHASQAQSGHWWRRAKAEVRARRLLRLIADGRTRRIAALGAKP